MHAVQIVTRNWKLSKKGTKKLSYAIKFKNEAYYVLMTFEADGKVVEELKRVAGIDADVVRRLITKL